ncbi:hypothetical protein FNF27_00004 [Cafeteria roenbergensis]|uniref:PITH domain-containing protein n=2 Tax=Cafeteria roenbergensis TaxID=33653 RepID=A0A5A8EN63_CAFRO|nr:hypothetical protein FNF27_00004 [Cafeteria roenbergensis]
MAAGGPADGLQELTGHVNLDGASCVNERPGFELRGALEGTGLLKSDDNDELLLQLPFKGSVHARFIEIEAPAGHRPKVIKIFRNRASMLIDDVPDIEPSAEMTDAEAAFDADGKVRFTLQASTWRNTTQVAIFMANEDLDGEDEMVHVSAVRIFGVVPGAVNTAELKGGGGMGNALAGIGGGMAGMGPGGPPPGGL